MYKSLLLSVLSFFIACTVAAQQPQGTKQDTVGGNIFQKTTDTVVQSVKKVAKADSGYVNYGKIAGRRAALSSMVVPGLGQIRNGVTVYRLAKVAGIYTGLTLLTLSFIDNNKNYHIFLDELLYRRENGKPNPESIYQNIDDQGLILAKDTFRRNKEVIIISYVGLYVLNIVEAYIDARLKYFDVGDIAFKVSPGVINTNTMYGFNHITPGVKLTLSF